MSREIKFRAWFDGKMWNVYSLSFTDTYFVTATLVRGGKAECASPSANETKLMQLTGLLDKNGKEIYEGDIVQDDGGYPGGVKYKGVIRFGGFEKAPCSFWSDTSVFGTPDGLKISKFAEVIGNIHENPDLLK